MPLPPVFSDSDLQARGGAVRAVSVLGSGLDLGGCGLRLRMGRDGRGRCDGAASATGHVVFRGSSGHWIGLDWVGLPERSP